MLRPLLKPKKGPQARAEAGLREKAGGLPGRAAPVQKYAPPPRYVTARKPVAEAAKCAPLHALPGPEPIKRCSSQGWANKCAVEMADAEAAHRAEQGQAPSTSRTTRSSSGHSTKHGADDVASQVKVPAASSHRASLAEVGKIKLSEPNFTWTPTPPLGMRKSYYFPDPPLPKEVHFAMALLVLAILSVALLLAYDVYHSFAHMPRRSNVTATGLSPTTTEPIPTPVFMR
ncbi:uncharacterized protein LOC142772179 [Rhipicephalus microplus]|uniref:uncharacterized protein LOC142772179 n=1 Tax=Rhipicephalus microplus TaxID=6941 RepID=UPI003F6B766F